MSNWKTPNDYFVQVENGNVPGVTLIHKFGSNATVGTSLTPITNSGQYQTPTTAQSLEVLSDSVNDTAGGSGARTVTIYGLDGAWGLQEVDVNLNGTTPVAVPVTFTRVFRMQVKYSGTYASTSAPSHNSTITLRGAGAGSTWCIITSEGGFGLGTTDIACYSVPAGYKAKLLDFHVDVESSKILTLVFFKREKIDIVTAPYEPMKALTIKRSLVGEHERSNISPLTSFVGPCDLGVMGKVSAGSGKIEAEFTLLLEQI